LEAERTPGEVANERLTQAHHNFGVHVVCIVVGGVDSVDNEGVLRLDKPLYKHSHLHELNTDVRLFARVVDTIVPPNKKKKGKKRKKKKDQYTHKNRS